MTNANTCEGFAPNAIRIPISRVRSETANETSPKMPRHAIRSAMTPGTLAASAAYSERRSLA